MKLRKALVLTVIFFVALFVSYGFRAEAATTYTCNHSKVNVREYPSTYNRKIGEIVKNQKVQVKEIVGDWARIKYGNGEGWVAKRYLTKSSGTATPSPKEPKAPSAGNGWVLKNGKWTYYNSKYGRTIQSNNAKKLADTYKNTVSKTKFMIVIDQPNCSFYLFEKNGSNWVPVYNEFCLVGAKASKTPTGNLKVINKRAYFDRNNRTFRYCLRFWGHCYIHSTAYYYHSYKVLSRNTGYPATHGCVSLQPEVAKWLYYNVPVNTKVVSIPRW